MCPRQSRQLVSAQLRTCKIAQVQQIAKRERKFTRVSPQGNIALCHFDADEKLTPSNSNIAVLNFAHIKKGPVPRMRSLHTLVTSSAFNLLKLE